MPGQYAESWVAWEAQSGGRNALQGDVAQIRAAGEQMVQFLTPLAPPFSENVTFKDGAVEGVKYRLYTPNNVKEGDSLPVAIWTHGGGYVVGDLDSDHIMCGLVAEHTNSIVINIDYHLAPEAKWPTQLNDCLAVYKWAHANASSFHGNPQKFYTIGGSAGGGLALQIANQIVTSPLASSLKGIAALVPLTAHWDTIPSKYSSQYTAYTENAVNVPILLKETMETFYTAVGADPKDPSLFTLYSENLSKFPRTYLTSCEFDPLRDDATVLETELKERGVEVKHDYYEGFPHYFWIIPAIPEGQTFVANLLKGIGWLLEEM